MTQHPQVANPRPLLAALAAASLLAACGGGGDGPAPAAGNPAQFKGRWATPANSADATTAIVLPDSGGTTASAWLLAQDRSRLVKLRVAGDGSASGKAWTLGADSAGQAISARLSETPGASPKRLSVSAIAAQPLVLEQLDTLATPASQTDAAGTWRASAGDNAAIRQWTVASEGLLTGSSTTGCTFSGKLGASTDSSAFSVQFNENCPDGARLAFTGIATVDAGKNRLTMVAANADESRGVALFFHK